MDIFYAIVAGVIQGLTEFLPVSSSGHLVVFHEFFAFNPAESLSFDVVLHLGTLAALLIFFWHDLWRYCLAFLQSLYRWDLKKNYDQLLAWYILAATLPAAIVGLLFEKELERIFRQSWSVALIMIIIGIMLYLADKYFAGRKEMRQLTLFDCVVIGAAQALALIPGVSRSGITIIAGLSRNLNRAEAARFSFLLATPIVFAAGLKKSADFLLATPSGGLAWPALACGFITAAVTGYFCVKYFLNFLQHHSLKAFAYYRVGFGLAVLLYLYAIL